MNKKKKIGLLIVELVLVILLLAGFAVWYLIGHQEKIVYKYSRSITYDDTENYAITSKDIEQASILASNMDDNFVENADELIGRYLTTTVYKGDYVSKNQLSKDPKKIDKNAYSDLADKRKIYLDINFKTAFAGDIEAGDYVDLLYTETSSGLPTERLSEVAMANGTAESQVSYSQARVFMQKVPVFQVYKNGAVYTKRTTDPTTLGKFSGDNSMSGESEEAQDVGAPDQVALTVTIQQYEEIMSRINSGQTISLVSRFDESQDTETNGYTVVKGNGAAVYVGEGNLEYNHNIITDDGEETSNDAASSSITLPSLYTFIKDLAKVSMTDEQRQRYATIYTRYTELMEKTQGTEWEINNPTAVTIDDINNGLDPNNSDDQLILSAFKTDLETLAKELKGNTVLLPW